MKTYISKTKILAIFCSIILLSSCGDYLDILPKGEKTPTTLADFEAFIRDEYSNQRIDVSNAINLLNDRFQSNANLNGNLLTKANYMWDESADRIYLNSTDESTYYTTYQSISSCNLIIQYAPNATEATEAQKSELIAYAKVLRAMNYLNLVNFYSETYEESTAASKGGVPIITSPDIDAAYRQGSVKDVYEFILKDVNEAIPSLKPTSPTPLHPTIGAAYAFLSRVYLQMSNYPEALKYADLALRENKELYDWVDYYEKNKNIVEDQNSYTVVLSPTNYDYVENYNFRHGNVSYTSTESPISLERQARFEDGDARGAMRWKKRTINNETYCVSTTQGFFNNGGMTTVEVYLIKAECLARDGKFDDAMDLLNDVRKKRILKDKYADLTASTEAQAIEYIRRTKDNEMILTIVPFMDARRYNLDAKYAHTLTKVVDGKTLSLSPTSHMWTMTFPAGAVNNPGNGTITQNVSK